MRKALTLLELLIVVVITLFVMAAIYFAYINLFRGFKTQTVASFSQTQSAINLEILRQDIEHAGFGINRDDLTRTTDLPVEYDVNNEMLVLRSTYNLTDDKTRGWAMVQCNNPGEAPVILVNELPSAFNPTSDRVVYLNVNGLTALPQNGLITTCPPVPAGWTMADYRYLFAYPYDSSETSGCIDQFCTALGYRIVDSDRLPHYCAQGTKVFVRDLLDSAKNLLRRDHLIYCVADFAVRYKWAGSLVDPSTLGAITLNDEVTNLQEVVVYLLVQASKKDDSFSFSGTTTIDGVNLSVTSVTEGIHYHWKVIKVVAKPMNLRR